MCLRSREAVTVDNPLSDCAFLRTHIRQSQIENIFRRKRTLNRQQRLGVRNTLRIGMCLFCTRHWAQRSLRSAWFNPCNNIPATVPFSVPSQQASRVSWHCPHCLTSHSVFHPLSRSPTTLPLGDHHYILLHTSPFGNTWQSWPYSPGEPQKLVLLRVFYFSYGIYQYPKLLCLSPH